MTNPDTDGISLLRVVLAFVVVSGLIALMGLILKHVKTRGFVMPRMNGRARRLQIVEFLPLDGRRRLAIVQCDNEEHLLLLGINEDIVIKSNLAKTSDALQIKDAL